MKYAKFLFSLVLDQPTFLIFFTIFLLMFESVRSILTILLYSPHLTSRDILLLNVLLSLKQSPLPLGHSRDPSLKVFCLDLYGFVPTWTYSQLMLLSFHQFSFEFLLSLGFGKRIMCFWHFQLQLLFVVSIF